jgi:hypothetical protein
VFIVAAMIEVAVGAALGVFGREAVTRLRPHSMSADEQEQFSRFSQQVGLDQIREEVRTLRLSVESEQARATVLINHLREVIQPMEDLRQVAFRVSDEREINLMMAEIEEIAKRVHEGREVGVNRHRLGELAANMSPLEELERALAIVSTEGRR